MRNLKEINTETGDYRIDFFTISDEIIPGTSLNAVSYLKALELGLDNMPKIGISFRIIRVIYNSLDKKEGQW